MSAVTGPPFWKSSFVTSGESKQSAFSLCQPPSSCKGNTQFVMQYSAKSVFVCELAPTRHCRERLWITHSVTALSLALVSATPYT